MRKSMPRAEVILWSYLRKRSLGGFRFNRQAEIGPFIVDFLCREKKLIVEVDGATHGDDHAVAYDEKRTAFLRAQGYEIFRFGNDDICRNLSGVLDSLLAILDMLPSTFIRR